MRTKPVIAVYISSLVIVTSAAAQDLNVFSNGTPANAERVNENFRALTKRPTVTVSPIYDYDQFPNSAVVSVTGEADVGLYSIRLFTDYGDGRWNSDNNDDEVWFIGDETQATAYFRLPIGLNDVARTAYLAMDMMGRRSEPVKVDVPGRQSFITSGDYLLDEPLVIPEFSCNGVQLFSGITLSELQVWPAEGWLTQSGSNISVFPETADAPVASPAPGGWPLVGISVTTLGQFATTNDSLIAAVTNMISGWSSGSNGEVFRGHTGQIVFSSDNQSMELTEYYRDCHYYDWTSELWVKESQGPFTFTATKVVP